MAADWITNIRNLMRLSPTEENERWTKHSIHRVPFFIADLNRNAYSPQRVSLGPYHHDEPHLKPMEEHKLRAVSRFILRSEKPLSDYITNIETAAQQLMDAYEQLDEKWRDHDRFIQLMITDGCFLLEILRVATESQEALESQSDYCQNDPIFSCHGVHHNVPYIRRDMLMIENQLPLLVLQKLVATAEATSENNERIRRKINSLILGFCEVDMLPSAPTVQGLHLVDVFRSTMALRPTDPKSSGPKYTFRKKSPGDLPQTTSVGIIPSATELHDAGIRFKASETKVLMDITFLPEGVLCLPVITIDDATEFTFLNLIALERLNQEKGNEVTSYVFFMDNLVNSAKDVHILRSQGIITNALGGDDAIASLFNRLSKDVSLNLCCSLREIHDQVNVYSKKRWNRWKASLRHTYFFNPWVTISFFAAALLMLLGIFQTVYSILGYHKPRK